MKFFLFAVLVKESGEWETSSEEREAWEGRKEAEGQCGERNGNGGRRKKGTGGGAEEEEVEEEGDI